MIKTEKVNSNEIKTGDFFVHSDTKHICVAMDPDAMEVPYIDTQHHTTGIVDIDSKGDTLLDKIVPGSTIQVK